MADQDAQDINQMMSATSDVVIGKPKKSKFLWIVLGCVVVGVGLGVVVYQQSLAPTPSPTVKVTPKPTPLPTVSNPSLAPNPIPSPVVPETNVITQVANTMTFPETGKLRVFTDLNNITLVVTITTGGQTKTITLPNRAVSDTQKMNFTDSTFEVTAGSIGTINAYLNSTSGPKMGGWILPTGGTKCGANGYTVVDMSPRIAWAEANLATGKTLFAKQCWADEIDAKDPSSYDFNDFFVAWGYASSTSSSASPVASISPSPSASPKASASPSPSPSASASPSSAGSSTVSPSPSASARVAMPDTSGGTPVTGVFEVTVGTISVGLVLLLLGLFGLLAL